MTENKPIIIDGVDVSGCDYFCFTKKQECYANDNDCNKSPNCYFKQLARCNKVISEIKGLAQSINDAFEEDDVERQLSYCKDIGLQIEKICEDV